MYLGTIEKQASEEVANSIAYTQVLFGRAGSVNVTSAVITPSDDPDRPTLQGAAMQDAVTWKFTVAGGPATSVVKRYMLTVKADILVGGSVEKVEDEIVIMVLPADTLCQS